MINGIVYKFQYLMMSSVTYSQWPVYSSRTPENGVICKDYAGYAETLAAESSRIFKDNVVEMETCSLTNLG